MWGYYVGRNLVWLALLLFVSGCAQAEDYRILYAASIAPDGERARVTLTLAGEHLPSKLVIHADPERHLDFSAEEALERSGDKITWRPAGARTSLRYEFVVSARKDRDSYDSLLTDSWAILRSDILVPPIAVTAAKGLQSTATLTFQLPPGWSSAAPYANCDESEHCYALVDPGRRFVRPKGWLILGNIASRQDMIAGTSVRVAAPSGQDVRLQDTLAFINWTLPYVTRVFKDLPPRILVVSGDDPLWRGGLSAPNSLFMHADRPLISGNRTSSMIHELIHIATSIHGTARSDWIVEGIAEYYAVEILRRSGGISERRFRETLEELAEWGEESEDLMTADSSGATTARAVGVMHQLDTELREATDGEAGLDQLAAALAEDGGEVSVARFVSLAERIGGKPLPVLAAFKSRGPAGS